MAILIDGYNLLHVTGIFTSATGPGSLQKLHAKFIQFLATALDPADAPHTEVVFDSKGRHSGSRRMLRIGDLTVHYAARDEDADTYIAELIASHSTPRRLVVVSSDHQIQRTARRRRAKAIDSHVWYAELMKSWRERGRPAQANEDAKPPVPLSPSEVSQWLEVFHVNDLPDASYSDSSPRIRPVQPLKDPATNQFAGQERETSETIPQLDENLPGEVSPGAADELFPPSYLEAIERELLAEAPPSHPTGRPRPTASKAREVKRRPKK